MIEHDTRTLEHDIKAVESLLIAFTAYYLDTVWYVVGAAVDVVKVGNSY